MFPDVHIIKHEGYNVAYSEDIGRAAAAHMSTHFSPLVAGERMRERLRTIGRMCPTDTSMGRGSI